MCKLSIVFIIKLIVEAAVGNIGETSKSQLDFESI